LPEFSEPVVEGGQGNAPGCAEFFLALPAVRKFLHQEGHLFPFVHKLRFLCKAIGQKIIGKHVLGGADTISVSAIFYGCRLLILPAFIVHLDSWIYRSASLP